MTKPNPIREALSDLLGTHGFRKKSNTWYTTNDECISVVNLQKSQYGDQFYLNFGIALKALDPPAFPKEYQCHIRFRLKATLPDSERDPCRAALDLEEVAVPLDDRKATIHRLMETYALTLLADCSSLKGIAAAYGAGRLNGAMVHKKARDLFV